MRLALARVGSTDRDNGGQLLQAVRIVPHPGFNRSTLVNDIALVELTGTAGMPRARLDRVSPARQQQLSSPFVTVLGWGRTDGGAPSRLLLEAEMPLVDPETCNQTLMSDVNLQRNGRIDGRRLCAGLSEGGVDSCNGDSGGPLLQRGGGGWVQLGIVSYGTPQCGTPGTYGVYTRVAAFGEWIDAVMGSAPTKPVQTTAAQTTASARPPSVPAVAATVLPPPSIGATANAPKITAAAASDRGLKLVMSRQALLIGDRFDITVTSPIDGWLLLFDESNDGKVTQLFPNTRSTLAGRDGRVRAGAPLRIPDASYGFALTAAEPKGRGRLTALVVKRREALGRTVPEAAFRARPDAAQWLGGIDRALAAERQLATGSQRGWIAATVNYVVR